VSERLYQDDAYQLECDARVTGHTAEGITLDRSVFYPTGGGQPGDRGWLEWNGGKRLVISSAINGEAGAVVHLAESAREWPQVGQSIRAHLDWDLRFRHMRMHTCMHLLGIVLPFGVTGGNISAQRSRLDFDMEETVDKDEATLKLNELIAADYPVSSQWISGEELWRQPELIRTLSVAPPRNASSIRLLQIGDLDLQPCGGTHVRRTGEIGRAEVVKVEKKGRRNRRVYVELPD